MFPFSISCSLMFEHWTFFAIMTDQGFTRAFHSRTLGGGWELRGSQRDEEEELASWSVTGTGTGTGRGETGWQRMPFWGKCSSCVVYYQPPRSYYVVL
jgi:hypothetical protein